MERERRDWIIIALILIIGMMLMYLAGQQAIQILSNWSVNADMVSHLIPSDQSGGQPGLIEPLRPEIGTPAAWMGTYLTPQAGQDAGNTPAPLVVFDPSATPSPTEEPVETGTVTATSSPVTTTTPTVTGTPPTATATTTATRTRTPKPPTATRTTTATSTATSTSTSTATSTSTSTATATPTATPTNTPVTMDPSITPTAVPAGADIGPADGNPGVVNDGSYYVIYVGGNPIVVIGPADTNYDMVYYEFETGSGNIEMDRVIVGITNDSTGQTYYEVFNWGNSAPDTNTNADTTTLSPSVSSAEYDNQPIATSNLYQDPLAPTSQQSGILIDVDNAPDPPPPATYNYVVIIAPVVPPPAPQTTPPSDATGQTNGIAVVDVPNP